MKRLVLVDGNALLHRAYHATPPLTTSKGELINAVLGLTNMLLKCWDDLTPDFMAIAWDKAAPTFRHAAYTQYKATRGPTDDSLHSQYDRVHQVINALNIPEFGVDGYEADDLIGTLARQAVEKDKKLEVIVLTGDRAIMQIIDKRIKILMPRKTLPERMQKLLSEGAESAVLSKKLATLDLKAPIKLDLSACKVHDYDKGKVISVFEELEFKSLITRLTGSGSDPLKGSSNVIASAAKQSSLDLEIAASSTTEVGTPRNDRGIQNQHTTDLDQAVEPVLKKMTEAGVLIDLKFLERLGKDLKARLLGLEKQIYSFIGHEFNLNSPKQLSEVLFDELHLPVIRKTKTGRSTDEQTLNELSSAHPSIPLLLEYRTLFKLVSTYIDALPKSVGIDARVHSTFNVEGAATGRLSSTNPNLQNIPVKGEMGGEIRKAFIAEGQEEDKRKALGVLIAPKGKVLLGADYSQIELRILAHLSGDKNLEKAFKEGLDIHAITASKIFNVPLDQITRQQRMVGKTMNFATLYGQGPRALSQQLKVDYATAKLYIEEYFAQFPKVRNWMASVLEFGYKMGFVETLSGRRRYIPELQAGNRMLKSFGERAAINHPIQGTSADMIKKAMVEIGRELSVVSRQSSDKKNLKTDSEQSERSDSCRLILQVHDELLFECNPKNLEKTAKLIKEKMENALKLDIPVVVDLKSGSNWGEMTPLKI